MSAAGVPSGMCSRPTDSAQSTDPTPSTPSSTPPNVAEAQTGGTAICGCFAGNELGLIVTVQATRAQPMAR
jgi:hypothetical protein